LVLFRANIFGLTPVLGGGKGSLMSYPQAIKELYGVDVDTIDIREDSLANTKEDYLTTQPGYRPSIIITNPPFFLGKEIITKALDDVADNGYVIMLLRLNFFGSKDRKPFFYNNMPATTYVHHRRFSFTPDNKTDSIEYMHAVWKKGININQTCLKLI